MAIRGYRDRDTFDIAAGVNSKIARRTLPLAPHEATRRRLAFLGAAQSLGDLRARPGLNLHAVQHHRRGQHAIRIDDQYRICFTWIAGDADDVEIADYH